MRLAAPVELAQLGQLLQELVDRCSHRSWCSVFAQRPCPNPGPLGSLTRGDVPRSSAAPVARAYRGVTGAWLRRALPPRRVRPATVPAQMALAQARHLVASSALASLQNGQVFVSAGGLFLDEHLRDRQTTKAIDDEGDDRVDERAVADRDLGRRIAADRCLEDDLELGEVDAAEEQPDRRHDDVVDERVDDRAERGADDHADRQRERVGLEQERAELSDHRAVLHSLAPATPAEWPHGSDPSAAMATSVNATMPAC